MNELKEQHHHAIMLKAWDLTVAREHAWIKQHAYDRCSIAVNSTGIKMQCFDESGQKQTFSSTIHVFKT